MVRLPLAVRYRQQDGELMSFCRRLLADQFPQEILLLSTVPLGIYEYIR